MGERSGSSLSKISRYVAFNVNVRVLASSDGKLHGDLSEVPRSSRKLIFIAGNNQFPLLRVNRITVIFESTIQQWYRVIEN